MAMLSRAPLGEGEEYELRVNDAPTYNVDEPREAKLVAWRLECFERAGVDALTASSLAVRRDIDRERVTSMAEAGATGPQLRAILL